MGLALYLFGEDYSTLPLQSKQHKEARWNAHELAALYTLIVSLASCPFAGRWRTSGDHVSVCLARMLASPIRSFQSADPTARSITINANLTKLANNYMKFMICITKFSPLRPKQRIIYGWKRCLSTGSGKIGNDTQCRNCDST